MPIPNSLSATLPNVNVVTLVQDSQPGSLFTGGGVALLGAYTIPAGLVGPNDVIEVQILWTCNNTTGLKTLAVNLTANAVITDARTTSNGSLQSWLITPANHSNGAQNEFNAVDPGGIATAPITVSTDMTKEQYIGLWGTVAVTTDSMQVQFVAIRIWKDATAAPSLYPGQGKKLLYGVNGHFDYALTAARIVQSCQTLGVTVYRCTYEGNSASLAVLMALAKAFQGTGISLYVCIDMALQDPNNVVWIDEPTAYQAGYGIGYLVASALVPLGVTLFECGNELDTKNGINPAATTGQFITDFTGTMNGRSLFTTLRGCMRGCIDGVHSVSNTALAGSNAFTQCGYGCMDGLWYGLAPDGTTGHVPVTWDFTAFHNYRVYGSLLGMAGNFSTNSWVNVLEKMWRNYGKPIFISEFNGNSNDTDVQRAQWVLQEMTRYVAHRKNYGLQGMFIYSAFDIPYNVLATSTTLESTLGTTFAAFIQANPDPGT